MADESAVRNAYQRIIAKAWRDPDFKAKLMADPRGVLSAEGIVLPDNLDVKVVENTHDTAHLVLPPSPAASALSEQDLADVDGGTGGLQTLPTFAPWEC